MTNKDKLKEMLSKRNPLLTTPLADTERQAVTPIDFYNPTPTEEVVKEKSIQVDKTTSTQVVKDTKTQTVKGVKPQVVKYTTHLKPTTIKAIKLLAVQTERKDYEIVGEAIEEYLKRGTPHK